MCGIAGLVAFRSISDEPVRRMVAAMHHRGPDGAEIEAPAAGVVLGSARLSIVDLSPAGRQPMADEDGHVWIVFNGEIYNFQQLRIDLETRGHCFRSRTDTEVVLRAYSEWGADSVHRLRGMFAFAVFDGRSTGAGGEGPTVFLARDHLGIKPLYFTVRDDVLAFASEVRALLASGLVPRALSPQGLVSYLFWGSTAEPLTLVEGIQSLPPGHHMRVRLSSGAVETSQELYWRLQPPAAAPITTARESGVAIVRSLLEDSVRLQLVADVPLGVFLSSGVDSTAIAALATSLHGGIDTVTVVFPEDEAYSEAALARETARRLGTRHHEIPLTELEMLRRLEQAMAALDHPSMDGVNTYFVSCAAREAGLKVALSGLGGDELFGGYATFAWVPRLQILAAIAGHLPPAVLVPAGNLSRWLAILRKDAAEKLADFLLQSNGLPHPYATSRALFALRRVRRLLNGGGQNAAARPWGKRFEDLVVRTRDLSPFARVSALEIGTYLVNTLLRDTDAMSMAHSLEVRVPFLDHAVVETVTAMPDAWQNGSALLGARTKTLLVDALGNLLPSEIVRQRKRTFTLPWERWLRGSLRRRVVDGIGDIPGPLRSLLNVREVRAVGREFLAVETGWARPWALYALNDWVRRHVGT
jgi:asparagine synthase (glutamine-hydrolysing)